MRHRLKYLFQGIVFVIGGYLLANYYWTHDNLGLIALPIVAISAILFVGSFVQFILIGVSYHKGDN